MLAAPRRASISRPDRRRSHRARRARLWACFSEGISGRRRRHGGVSARKFGAGKLAICAPSQWRRCSIYRIRSQDHRRRSVMRQVLLVGGGMVLFVAAAHAQARQAPGAANAVG